MEVKDNIKNYYKFDFFSGLFFIAPVLVLFWQDNGLNLTEVMLLQSIFAILVILLEIPTGVVADKWGKRNSIVLASLLLLFYPVIQYFGSNFLHFAFGQLVYAMGVALMSGADSALLYDSLKQTKKEKTFSKVWGNTKSLLYLAGGIAAVVGGFVAHYSLRANWILVFLAWIITFIVSLQFIEPKASKKAKQDYLKHTFDSFKETFSNKPLLFLFLFAALFTMVHRIAFWFFQPYMQESGISITVFGVVWASFTIFAILGSQSAFKLERKLGYKRSLGFIILLMVGSLFLMSQFIVAAGIMLIFVTQYVRGFVQPVLEGYTHKLLNSEKRATLLSIQYSGGPLGFAIIAPIFGYIADKFSLSTSLLILSIFFGVAFMILMLWAKK